MNKVVGEIEMNRYSPQELWAELRDFTVDNCVQVQIPTGVTGISARGVGLAEAGR